MSERMSFLQQLQSIIPAERVLQDEPLSAHTYTKLGGKADYFVAPHTYEEVQAVLELAHQEAMPFMILGFGSNLIVRDGGIRGVVL
ncbi:FAD-binding protein, partial [Exiguobacterium aestuarii]|uniref:FAD-binding protein n=1 Tax=Exiguobacterium aestuarii TaxID=273527 RepID=UPI0035E453BF